MGLATDQLPLGSSSLLELQVATWKTVAGSGVKGLLNLLSKVELFKIRSENNTDPIDYSHTF